MISHHLTSFDKKPVVEFQPGMTLHPQENSYRLRLDYDATIDFAELVAAFAGTSGVDQVTGLITGAWSEEMFDESMAPVIESIVAAAEQFTSLRCLFFGDITSEENEISWIEQSDVSPVWQAFPRLRNLQIRGGNGLSLGSIVHDQLSTLIIESGGLPGMVTQQIAAARLPELEHLEVYLGTRNYGADTTIDDILPILSKSRFPKLRYLGLGNSDIQNEIVPAVMQSEIVSQIEVLDFSLGTLTDEGAQSILKYSDRLQSLQKLDLSFHFLTDEMTAKLAALPFNVDVSDQQTGYTFGNSDEVHRYTAIGE